MEAELNTTLSPTANETLQLQNTQGATAVLYWNAPLPEFLDAPTINITSGGAGIESGIVTVTGVCLCAP